MQADLAKGVTAAQAAPWSAGALPRDRKLRHRISLTALLLGVGLLWPFPVGAAVLMVAAAFVLVISWEDELKNPPPISHTADAPPCLRKETQ